MHAGGSREHQMMMIHSAFFFFNLAQLVNLFTLDGTMHLAAINTINVKEKKEINYG